MRPLALKVEGLTSFKTTQEIDFSDFDLFVITGPTGSGKSTILDAITFALYGDIARVNDNELRHMISHGSSFARVSLDFEVDKTVYRVARRMGRKEAQKATLERIDDGNPVSEVEQSGVKVVNKRIEEIVGLDFNTFIKAVLLPQGAFDRFLKGNVADRRQLLMRLLDLGRYEAAGRLARREAARLDAVLGERAGLIEANYQDATPARLAELKRVLKEVHSRHKEVGKAGREARTVAERATASEKEKATLQEAAGDIDEALAALTPLEKAWPLSKEKERTTSAALVAAMDGVKAAEEAFALARSAREATVKKTGDVAAIAVLEHAATALRAEEATIADLDQELKTSVPDAKASGAAVAAATKQLNDADVALKKQTGELERLENRREQRRAMLVQAQAAEAADVLDHDLTKATSAQEKAQDHARKSTERRRHLEHEHTAAALRQGLAPGDSCPVCSAVIEVLPKGDANIEALLVQAAEDAATAETTERNATDRVVELRAQAKVAAQVLAEASAAVDGENGLTPADARRLFEEAERSCKDASVEKQKKEKALQQAQQKLREAERQLGSSESKVTGSQRLREAAVKRFEASRVTLLKEFPRGIPKDLVSEVAMRRDMLASRDKALFGAQENLDEARRNRDARQEARQESERDIAAFDQALAGAQAAARLGCQALGRLLSERTLPSLPDTIDDRKAVMSGWRRCCSDHLAEAKLALHAFNETISSAVLEIDGIASGHGIHLKAKEVGAMAEEMEQTVAAAGRSVTGAEKDVEAHEKRILERAELETGMAKDRQRLALYQSLARELRADHFIAYVLEESMGVLAIQAGDELQSISDGRYSLVADEGSFEVVDHHNADERRSVATLSGGETFLASLSLALALSVGLRELAGAAANRLEAMFIDEGFGALDPDTLGVVVDALERLREGDRMVGVITHVETLAQRIPAGLAVQTDGGSSRIVVR
jgi:exonuclease SbcC